ncbi:DUF6934 family protein [Parafilimonas sp.]|uniref:DUF6934 family protein n=1 Tax=Parafilimonas sp. TaxID=1969739 RepID=UPI0039E43DEB
MQWLFATGSTKARTRLYRIGITNNLTEIQKDFDVYGLLQNGWQSFEKQTEYSAFLATKKKINFPS